MARRPKPWYREERGEWFVTFRGVQHRLGPDKTEAYRRFHELVAKPEQTVVSGSVAEVIEHFMDWTEKNRTKSYKWYKKRIDHFYPKIRDMRTSDLRPLHIQQVLDKYDWSDAYNAGCVTAMKRVFNWRAGAGLHRPQSASGPKEAGPGPPRTDQQREGVRRGARLRAEPELPRHYPLLPLARLLPRVVEADFFLPSHAKRRRRPEVCPKRALGRTHGTCRHCGTGPRSMRRSTFP